MQLHSQSTRLALAFILAAAAGTNAQAQGQLYTATNASTGNEIAIFDRGADGAVSFQSMISTGGLGTDGSLGNQGGVILTEDERYLLVVNAGSNNISVFKVLEDSLQLIDVEPARGTTPVSLTQNNGFVYVVNAGTDSVAGFKLKTDGDLDFLPGSLARLSGMGTAPAQIQFGPQARNLYVTEKATNNIVRFGVTLAGTIQNRQVQPSAGQTPFGFDFGRRGQMFVSEAAGGAAGAATVSSYEQMPNGSLATITSALPFSESAACWIALTPDARFLYTSNTASDSISVFGIAFDGSLSLLDARTANTAPGPLDMGISRDSRFFYVLDGGAGLIGDYTIGLDGALTGIPGSEVVLPAGANGLAVR